MSEKTLEDIIFLLKDRVNEDAEKSAKAAILQRIREVMPGERLHDQFERGWNSYREEMLKRLEQL